MAAHSSLFTVYIMYRPYYIHGRRYISEQKAAPRGRAGGGRGAGGVRAGRRGGAGGHAHTRAPPTSERADRPTRSTYSYYYERRNAFCRARTKFVVPLPLLIIKIVNAFLLAEVCGVTHRCRVSFSSLHLSKRTCNVFKCASWVLCCLHFLV